MFGKWIEFESKTYHFKIFVPGIPSMTDQEWNAKAKEMIKHITEGL